MKSGCRAEQSKLRTAERLVNLLATFCVLGWRIFWLTMLNRSTRKARPTLAFTPLEIELLNRLAHPSATIAASTSDSKLMSERSSHSSVATSHVPVTRHLEIW